MREPVLKRVPPEKSGDNYDKWVDLKENSDIIFQSLTEGLEYIFGVGGCTEYHISTFEGTVYMVTPDKPKPKELEKKLSMYGEDQ